MKTIMKTILLVTVLALILAFGAGCQPQEVGHVHTLIHNEAKAPTCVNNGILEHWYCPACNARFTDEAATKAVTFADLEVEELGHKAGQDDGDCTTAVDCTVCGEIATPAKPHTPAEDDGDCTTAVKCADCDQIAVAAKEAHEAGEDDGDCTTAVKCANCDQIVVEAKEAHTYVDGYCSACNSVDPNFYFPTTIPEALAKADGSKVEVSGTVSAINTAWSDSHGNISVTITDDGGKTLYLYRLKTNVALGDIITVKGDMATYSGKRQIAAGATATITGHDSSYDYVEMSIADAIAADDNTNVIVTGTVVKIGTAYSSEHNNISVYIADENGTQLYLYRLSGDVTVGQVIKVKGAMATYSGARQVTGGTFEAVGTHECTNFADATCYKASACVVCGTTTGNPLGHTTENGICERCGEAVGDAAPVVDYYVFKATAADGTAYYWDGTVASGKGTITTDAASAAKFVVEEATGGYYVYTVVDGVKNYIKIGTSNTSLSLTTTATVISYDAATGYVYSGERYIATYGTQDIRTYNASNIPGGSKNLYMVLTAV